MKKTPTAATPAKKTTVATSTEQSDSSSLGLKHTPALLELAQQSDKKETEKDGAPAQASSEQSTSPSAETNKMEESENQLVESLDDDNEKEDMIFIASSEDEQKNDEDGGDLEVLADDEDTSLIESIVDSENDAKESGSDDNVAAESTVVETVDKETVPAKKPAKKNKNKDSEDEGILDLVASYLGEDETEDQTKTEVSP